MRNLLMMALSIWLGMTSISLAASLDGLAVNIKNESEPVLCAEKDNVAISYTNKEVRSFRIEAAHPVYLSAGLRSNFEADWTACDMSADPAYAATSKPRKVTLYEQTDLWIIGYTFPAFWRPSKATLKIGKKVEKDIHMLQVWVLRDDGAEEVLVLYPQDGYWRPRPMTPPDMRSTGYGSSFLVGPIDYKGRPHVDIKEVRFDPETRTFDLDFAKGGNAKIKLVSIDSNRLALNVSFDNGITGGPFAMLRSMYITEFNNDVARIAVREKGAESWREQNIMKFDHARATDAWMGRLSPSQHNTTSPDVVFNSFSSGPYPKRPKSEPPPEAKPNRE